MYATLPVDKDNSDHIDSQQGFQSLSHQAKLAEFTWFVWGDLGVEFDIRLFNGI